MQKPEQSASISQRFNRLSRDEKAGISLLIIALALGVLVRLIHIANVSFPINDGGLFYTMTRDLQANHFLIPAVTSYNHSNLPFAYPPFGFYLAGELNMALGWDLLGLMQWLPFIFNLLCIPVFFLFARRLMNDPLKAGIATLFFALLKPGYEWLIMGGGLARSPAMLFSLLALDRYLALITSNDKRVRRILAAAIFCALTFLAHLEIGWFTIYSLALLWFFRGRNKQNFIFSIFIMLGVLIFTSPYWAQVFHHHRFQPFVTVVTSGGYDLRIILFELINFFNFGEELIFPILGMLVLTGFIISLTKRDYLMPVWMVLNMLLDARSVNRSNVIPAAMLISVGIVEGVYVLILKFQRSKNSPDTTEKNRDVLFSPAGMLVLYLLCAQVALTAYLTRLSDPILKNILTGGDLRAMAWVRENTPENSRFFILPTSTFWGTDAVGEWFPALSGRTNVLTVQGNEWLPDYRQRITDFKQITDAIASGSLDIKALLEKYPDIRYLYLPLEAYRGTSELAVLRSLLQGFPLIFQNADVEIYQIRAD